MEISTAEIILLMGNAVLFFIICGLTVHMKCMYLTMAMPRRAKKLIRRKRR